MCGWFLKQIGNIETGGNVALDMEIQPVIHTLAKQSICIAGMHSWNMLCFEDLLNLLKMVDFHGY